MDISTQYNEYLGSLHKAYNSLLFTKNVPGMINTYSTVVTDLGENYGFLTKYEVKNGDGENIEEIFDNSMALERIFKRMATVTNTIKNLSVKIESDILDSPDFQEMTNDIPTQWLNQYLEYENYRLEQISNLNKWILYMGSKEKILRRHANLKVSVGDRARMLRKGIKDFDKSDLPLKIRGFDYSDLEEDNVLMLADILNLDKTKWHNYDEMLGTVLLALVYNSNHGGII